MVVATAASMDGYAAFGASITRDGFKQTMACPAPAAIVADLDILAAAPTPLTAAGYGDLLGKVTAGADWLVADALEVEPIDRTAWALVQEPLAGALGAPERLAAHDPAATEQFFLGLVISGLAMQATQSSRPASGAEHLLSHLWEMTGLAEGAEPAVARDQGRDRDGAGDDALRAAAGARPVGRRRRGVRRRRCPTPRPSSARSGPACRPARSPIAPSSRAWRSTRPPTSFAARLALLRERWPDLRERLRTQLLPPAELRRRLHALGAASLPHEIGITAGSPARGPARGAHDPAPVHGAGPGGRGRAAGALRRRGRRRARRAIQTAATRHRTPTPMIPALDHQAGFARWYAENRILTWICALTFVNQLGFGAIVPAVPLYARTFGVSLTAIGLTIAGYGLARLLSSLPAGQISDRFGRTPRARDRRHHHGGREHPLRPRHHLRAVPGRAVHRRPRRRLHPDRQPDHARRHQHARAPGPDHGDLQRRLRVRRRARAAAGRHPGRPGRPGGAVLGVRGRWRRWRSVAGLVPRPRDPDAAHGRQRPPSARPGRAGRQDSRSSPRCA